MSDHGSDQAMTRVLGRLDVLAVAFGAMIGFGWIVLTGGMTDAYFSTPGTSISCHFTHLGSVRIHGGE